MILMRVASPTTLRMVTALDMVGDAQDVAAVTVVDMAIEIMVDMVVALTLVVVQILLGTPTLPRAALICRLMETPMMMHSSYMIT